MLFVPIFENHVINFVPAVFSSVPMGTPMGASMGAPMGAPMGASMEPRICHSSSSGKTVKPALRVRILFHASAGARAAGEPTMALPVNLVFLLPLAITGLIEWASCRHTREHVIQGQEALR